MKGGLLAVLILVITFVLIAMGTLWPSEAALALSGTRATRFRSPSTPEAAVSNLLAAVGRHDWGGAYSSLANHGDFSEQDFIGDLNGTHESLRSYAMLSSFDVKPLHATADEAQVRAILHWSTVVGRFDDVRTVAVRNQGGGWRVAWPLVRESKVPPQVIPVNYLRWDVIYRGPGDDWGMQDVDSPHVRILDMHPLSRGESTVILGELLNEDVVPAFVEVKATLLAKDGAAIAAEDSFDQISHVLLPKQVTPFRINFRGVKLSQIDSVRMQPSANLISTSADPVVAIEDQHLTPAPDAALTGMLVNQSGQVVNVAHVLGTFYDKSGQVVWVSDGYASRALVPGAPVPFAIAIPPDIAAKVSNYRAVASTYSWNRTP
ncbi:MAG: hypothetical protein JO159_15930 [Acidobacteria bacterium]|nr:hypothetical protein [Acidobacteriota bacterium]